MSQPTIEEVVALAKEAGVDLHPMAEELPLFSVRNAILNVYMTWDIIEKRWKVRRKCRNRWKTVYRGKLEGAIAEAKSWLSV